MKHPARLMILNLVGAALGCAALPGAAEAQIKTYYHAGVWDAFSGRNDKGGVVCGVGNTNPVDGRRTSIRFDVTGTETLFSVSKPDWSIPDNTRITIVMQVGLSTPWTEQADGHGHSIDWSLDRSAIVPFNQQFRSAASMTLTFPEGNEPPWTVPLTGSSAISDAFERCVRDLTLQAQNRPPLTRDAAPPQGGPAATQPFNPPPDAAVSRAPAADVPGSGAPRP